MRDHMYTLKGGGAYSEVAYIVNRGLLHGFWRIGSRFRSGIGLIGCDLDLFRVGGRFLLTVDDGRCAATSDVIGGVLSISSSSSSSSSGGGGGGVGGDILVKIFGIGVNVKVGSSITLYAVDVELALLRGTRCARTIIVVVFFWSTIVRVFV